MRLYSFVNAFYMKEIQWGLQTAHLVADMSLQNNDDFNNWAQNHKTITILNGGNMAGLESIFFDVLKDSGFCVDIFREDAPSLGGITTCVGIIAPEFLVTEIEFCRKNRSEAWQASEMANFISQFSLAR